MDEFEAWCNSTAKEWGYQVSTSSVGKAIETDPWGRDDELGGATQVAVFRRLDSMSNAQREQKGRRITAELGSNKGEHELLAAYKHEAHSSSMKPKSLKEIGDAVQEKMQQFSVSFIRLEEIWFESDIAVMCGGWIEHLARAVDASEHLKLNRGDGVRKERTTWTIELLNATHTPTNLWPTEDGMSEAMMPPEDWIPEEETSAESSDFDCSTGNDGDVSWGASEAEDDEGTKSPSFAGWGFKTSHSPIHWTSDAEDGEWKKGTTKWVRSPCGKGASNSAMAGWEGDYSDETS